MPRVQARVVVAALSGREEPGTRVRAVLLCYDDAAAMTMLSAACCAEMPAESAARLMSPKVMLAESPWFSLGVPHPQLAHIFLLHFRRRSLTYAA
jgi:hypothetical protein